jgi:hypothetical protein
MLLLMPILGTLSLLYRRQCLTPVSRCCLSHSTPTALVQPDSGTETGLLAEPPGASLKLV